MNKGIILFIKRFLTVKTPISNPPKCINCMNLTYEKGVPKCFLFGKVNTPFKIVLDSCLTARSDPKKCGIKGIYFTSIKY
jgi:hypothetical protein